MPRAATRPRPRITSSSNRGKRSLAIDFTKTAGQKLIRGLAERADVLIENFRVGTLARYGLGYQDLKTR